MNRFFTLLLAASCLTAVGQVDLQFRFLQESVHHIPRTTEIKFFSDSAEIAFDPTSWFRSEEESGAFEDNVQGEFVEPYPFGYSVNCNDQGWIIPWGATMQFTANEYPNRFAVHTSCFCDYPSAVIEVSVQSDLQWFVLGSFVYDPDDCGWTDFNLPPFLEAGCTDSTYGQDEPQCDCPVGINIDGFDFVGNSGESSYYYYNQPVPWTEAQALSQAVGGHIISISSETEQLFLDSVILSTYIDPHWIGLFQNVLSDDYVEPNGGWEWVTGEPLDYVNWIDGEPNEATPGENYGTHHAYSSDYGWNDGHNADVPLVGTPWRFVMEKTCCSFYGCTDTLACNYNPMVFIEDESCYSCDIPASHCGAGTTWDESSQTCIVANPSDSNFDGCVQLNDLLDLLSAYGDCAAEESPWQCGDPLEYQGYDYETVQIGEQCWFADNLRSEKYSTGDEITSNLSQNDWVGTIHGASCVYGEEQSPCENFSPTIEGCNPEESLEFYGRLYNWFAVTDERGLCPTGWHSPDDNEWQVLSAHLGGSATAGVNMKSTSGWREGGDGDNSSGFNGYPAGDRYAVDGEFYSSGNTGFWWSSTFLDNPQEPGASFYFLEFGNGELKTSGYPPNNGMSVRCLKDTQ